jgi:PHS family inorganic phosphate transporter-like MFS transporter
VPKPLPFSVTLAVLREYSWTLCGTASTWFLIDVTFYGQSLMNTTVVNNAVSGVNGVTNSVDKLRYSLLSTVWIMIIALPGYWVAIGLIDRMGRWWMQMQGFVMSAVCFAVLAGAFSALTARGGAAFIFVYGLTYFFANFGANSTTFLMPVEVFPTRARATAHGISAACGKIGATVGSIGLLSLYNSFCTASLDANGTPNCSAPGAQQAQSDAGVRAVMTVCVAVSLLGAAMTAIFVRESGGRTLEEVDAGSAVLREHDRLRGHAAEAEADAAEAKAAAANEAAAAAAKARGANGGEDWPLNKAGPYRAVADAARASPTKFELAAYDSNAHAPR